MLQILKLGGCFYFFFLFFKIFILYLFIASVDFHQEKWIYVHKGSTKEVSIRPFVKEYAWLSASPNRVERGSQARILLKVTAVVLGAGDGGWQPVT